MSKQRAHAATLVSAMLAAGAASLAAMPCAAASGPSSGCQQASSAGVVTLKSADGKKQSRTYLVQVPSNYDATRAYPVAFVFHGSGSNAKQAYSWGLQRAAGAAESAIFVFPNGSEQKDGFGWDDRADGADLPFFDNMLTNLKASFCVDSDRVFVAGFSWGGDFVVALACRRADLIRAVEANSTDDEFKDSSNYLTYQGGLPCAAHKRPAIRFEHAQDGDSSYPPPNFATTSQLFRHLNSCGAGGENIPSSTPGTKCTAYAACSSSYAECVFDKHFDHSLPPNWAEDTWAFFASFK